MDGCTNQNHFPIGFFVFAVIILAVILVLVTFIVLVLLHFNDIIRDFNTIRQGKAGKLCVNFRQQRFLLCVFLFLSGV